MSKNLRKLIYCALLIAIGFVLSYISGYFATFKITLGPVAVMLAGALLGPVYGGITGAAVDILTLFYKQTGAYFPGFTLTMALYGILSAIFFYKKDNPGNVKTVLYILIIQTVCSALLNTLFISYISGTPFWTLFITTRIIPTYASFAVYAVVMCLLLKYRNKMAVYAQA
ncbi:MAG: folate family ECF transporter S component [Christensenellaceae bacterium]